MPTYICKIETLRVNVKQITVFQMRYEQIAKFQQFFNRIGPVIGVWMQSNELGIDLTLDRTFIWD